MSKRPVHVLRKGNSSEDDNDSKRPALPSPPADTTAAMSKAALYEQATAKLFKSSDVPTKLISSIYTSSDAALAEGVMSVTFGSSSNARRKGNSEDDNESKLFHTIHKAYNKNLDILEIYCMRNIFNLDKKLCKRVLGITKRQKYDNNDEDGVGSLDEEDKQAALMINNKMDGGEGKITEESLTKLDEELRELRTKLVQSKRRKELFEHHLEKVRELKKQSTCSVNAVKLALQQANPNNNNLQELVSAVVMGREGLLQVREEGLELLRKMDVTQVDGHDQNNNNTQQQGQKISLEEDYAAFRKEIKTEDVAQVAALVNKLKNDARAHGKEDLVNFADEIGSSI